VAAIINKSKKGIASEMQLRTTGFMPGSEGARLQTCVFVGMHVCFVSDIGAHDCHCMCGCTLTSESPRACSQAWAVFKAHLLHRLDCVTGDLYVGRARHCTNGLLV